MNATGKLLVILTLFLIMLAAWAVYDGIASVAIEELPADTMRAYRMRAWIKPFFELLPVALVSAIVITFSFALTVYDLGGEGTIFARTRGPLLIVLLLGMLNAYWVLFLQPYLDQRIDEITYRGRFIEQLKEDIERDISIPETQSVARDRVSLYRVLLGEDADSDETLRMYEERLGESGPAPVSGMEIAASQPSEENGRTVLTARERGVVDLIEAAEEAFEENDFFSAHYLASQAIELDGEGELARSRAQPLQSRAWEAIRSQSREIRESDEARLFRAKIEAFEALQRGTRGAGNPEQLIEAYYRFEELHKIAPDDPDVVRYRAETAVAIESVTFFVEDARFWAREPAAYDLFFLNREETDLLEFVWVTRVVSSHEGVWLYDVEVLRLSGLGGERPEIVHYRADYGKYVVEPMIESGEPLPERIDRPGLVLVRAIRREGEEGTGERPVDPDNLILPTYYEGEPQGVLEEAIRLTVPLGDLLRLAGGPERAVRLPLPTLLGVRDSFAAIGRDPALIWREIAARTVRVFGFFIAAYWSIAIAWRYRSSYLGRAPIFVYIALPIVPIVVYQIVLIVRRILLEALDGLMIGSRSGVYIVITVLVASLLALLGALVALARQSIHP